MMDSCQFQQQFLPQNYSYGDIKLDFKTENDFQVEFHASINSPSGKIHMTVDLMVMFVVRPTGTLSSA